MNENGIRAGKIETDTLAKLGIYLPSPAEQQEIADCLTSVDELIVAQGRKVEALKAHKKGLMQQLFPREGGTLPRLRFPEFRDGPVWEEKMAGRLLKSNPQRRGRFTDLLCHHVRWNGETRFFRPQFLRHRRRCGQ